MGDLDWGQAPELPRSRCLNPPFLGVRSKRATGTCWDLDQSDARFCGLGLGAGRRLPVGRESPSWLPPLPRNPSAGPRAPEDPAPRRPRSCRGSLGPLRPGWLSELGKSLVPAWARWEWVSSFMLEDSWHISGLPCIRWVCVCSHWRVGPGCIRKLSVRRDGWGLSGCPHQVAVDLRARFKTKSSADCVSVLATRGPRTAKGAERHKGEEACLEDYPCALAQLGFGSSPESTAWWRLFPVQHLRR